MSYFTTGTYEGGYQETESRRKEPENLHLQRDVEPTTSAEAPPKSALHSTENRHYGSSSASPTIVSSASAVPMATSQTAAYSSVATATQDSDNGRITAAGVIDLLFYLL
jgi:hypothetical protein